MTLWYHDNVINISKDAPASEDLLTKIGKFSFPLSRRRRWTQSVKRPGNDETEKICIENYNQPFVTYLINDNKRDK